VSLSFTVTFRDLQKLVQSQQSGPEQSQLFRRLKDKPFWIWDPKQHKHEDLKTRGDCCFNHIIGLPRKDGIEKSIFDYERLPSGTFLAITTHSSLMPSSASNPANLMKIPIHQKCRGCKYN
jgi:hypothetical protein